MARLLSAHVAVLGEAALALAGASISVPGNLGVDECAREARAPGRGAALRRNRKPVVEEAMGLLVRVGRRSGGGVGGEVDVVVGKVCEAVSFPGSLRRECQNYLQTISGVETFFGWA